MPTGTLTSKGRITIPKLVRDRLELSAGDRLVFRFTPEGILVLETADQEPLGRLPGLLHHLAPEHPVPVEAMRPTVRRRAHSKSGRPGER